jgi:hypothetical protein
LIFDVSSIASIEFLFEKGSLATDITFDVDTIKLYASVTSKAGDCDNCGEVTIDEVQSGINQYVPRIEGR